MNLLVSQGGMAVRPQFWGDFWLPQLHEALEIQAKEYALAVGKIRHRFADHVRGAVYIEDAPRPMMEKAMDFQPLRVRFADLLWRRDIDGIRGLLAENPAFFSDPECRADVMIAGATRCEQPTLVALLYELGADLNIGPPSDPIYRPVHAAAASHRWETVRWLVEHGAEVNYEVGGREPHCLPLASAIIDGRVDIVKLLVGAGALLNVCDRRNKTPLTWAIDCGRAEIADYLSSKGAVLAPEARNYEPPPAETSVTQYMESHFGSIKPLGWQPVVPTGAPVVVHTVWHEDFAGAFTDGMSARPMAVPHGQERYRFAELAMPLGEYWPDDPKSWGEGRYSWAVQWLLRLAEYPFEEGIWLGDPHCVIANSDPPEPLSAFTPMTCWLLLVDKAPLTGFALPDETEVVFYTVLPIHTAEREYERRHGLKALLELFAEQQVSPYLDPHRKSVV